MFLTTYLDSSIHKLSQHQQNIEKEVITLNFNILKILFTLLNVF